MQASWGAENSAPGPARGGLLFGEAGTWKVSMECSVPDVFTYADKEVRAGREGGLGRAGAVIYSVERMLCRPYSPAVSGPHGVSLSPHCVDPLRALLSLSSLAGAGR